MFRNAPPENGFVQTVDLAAVMFLDDTSVWHGASVGNGIVVFETIAAGRSPWHKPGQDSSPYPCAVIQTARYSRKSDPKTFLDALGAEMRRCTFR